MDEKTRNHDRSLIRSLAEAMPQAVVVIDRNDRVLAANSAAHAILPGLQTDIPLARSLRAPDVLDALDRVREDGRSRASSGSRKFRSNAPSKLASRPLRRDFEPALMLSLHDLSRSPPARAHARRFRRQCEP